MWLKWFACIMCDWLYPATDGNIKGRAGVLVSEAEHCAEVRGRPPQRRGLDNELKKKTLLKKSGFETWFASSTHEAGWVAKCASNHNC